MSKTKISEFSTTPGNNTDINGINIAEGCAPSGINNAIRELMSDLKEWQSGAMDVYVIPQGTAAAPGIQLYGDLDTGLYGFAANQLGVAVGGASAGYFSSDGWVGNVVATTVDLTNIEVTNIKAKDGTAAITIADSTGAVGVSTAVTFSATTQNIALGTSQTTGTFTVGGAAQTGTQTLDQSTKTHTFNVATGATESGATKTVNIATAGVSGSTTTISIGSSVSGATSTTTLSGNVTATRDMTVNGITVGKGKGSEGSNTALGLSALAAFTTGESSTAIGQYALWKATTSAFNTAVGTQSQLNSLTGGYNTSVGALTLNTATASSFNVAIGFSALNLATGDNNTAVGNSAGSLITTGAKNTIIGNYTGNQGGLDITTSSNYIVLSDGDGNPRAYWNGANATFGGTLTATTITGTQVNSDNLRLDGNTLSSTDTNGNIVIAPNGTGQVQLSGALDVTNIEVTNIKAKDGTAALSIADSTGVVSVSANPVLSGGTANGVLYLNASKAATSGTALTFDGTTLTAPAFSGPINGTVGATTPNTGNFTTLTATSLTVARSTSWTQSTDTYTTTSSGVSDVHTGMRRCVVRDDGSVNYYLNPTDSTQKVDGSASVLTGADGMVMVEIPAFYVKFTPGSTRTWSISLLPAPGYTLHPAFVKDGAFVPYRYYGAYDACVNTTGSTYQSGLNYDSNVGAGQNWNTGTAKLASVSGIYPAVGITRAQARSMAANRGIGWRLVDAYLMWAVELLFLVEFGTFRTQQTIGDGNVAVSTGYPASSGNQTDSPHSVAGKSNSIGNASTNTTNGASSGTRDTAFMSYRGIENWYSNCWNWVDGYNINSNQAYVSNTRANFADDTATNYNAIGAAMVASNGYVTNCQNEPFAFLPSAVGGSSSTYWADYYYQTSGWRVAFFGGNAVIGADAGGFCWNLDAGSGAALRGIGARLAF